MVVAVVTRVDCARIAMDGDARRIWEDGIVLRGRVDRAREAIVWCGVKIKGMESIDEFDGSIYSL